MFKSLAGDFSYEFQYIGQPLFKLIVEDKFWLLFTNVSMPNLKKFCHSLCHEMASHLFPFLTFDQ